MLATLSSVKAPAPDLSGSPREIIWGRSHLHSHRWPKAGVLTPEGASEDLASFQKMQSPKFGVEPALFRRCGECRAHPRRSLAATWWLRLGVAEADRSPGTQPGGGAGRSTAHPVPEGEFAPITSYGQQGRPVASWDWMAML